MITFEPNTSSSFYLHNKVFVEAIAGEFQKLGTDVSGYCNSFGYELEAKFKHHDHNYSLKFTKNQSTQNGVVWPVDALDFCGLEVQMDGFKTQRNIHIGRSKFKRFFTSARLKSMIPSPYFIKLSNSQNALVLGGLIRFVLDYKMNAFELNKGTVTFKIFEEISNPVEIIESLEKILSDLT